MPSNRTSPFTVNDLSRWADVQDLAAKALDPKWSPMSIGIPTHYKCPIPPQNAKLPNGFQFPSAMMTDFQRLAFFAVISTYMGPDPTTSPAFDRVRNYVIAKYGEFLNKGTAHRFLIDLIRYSGMSIETAGALTLEAAMDCMDANEVKRESEGGKTASAGLPSKNTAPSGSETNGEKSVNSPDALRSPEQLLQAFGKAVAQFSTTRLRMAAFRDAGQDDGKTLLPISIIPKDENGQPRCQRITIGGHSTLNFDHHLILLCLTA